MNALFLLALLASPSRAGVVMPVESGVAPAGTSGSAVPVLAPLGGSFSPVLGGGLDLRGMIPLLPAPVPGLAGPALNFIGGVQEAAAARPETAAAAASAETPAGPGAKAKAPVIPAKPIPGGASLAIARDHHPAASAPDAAYSSALGAGKAAAAAPLVNFAELGRVRPEPATGFGRAFFDRSADKDQSTFSGPGAAGAPTPSPFVVAATLLDGGASASGPGSLGAFGGTPEFGGGHAAGLAAHGFESEGEVLHDAVASPLPGGAVPGGAAAFFGSAAPNGELLLGGGFVPRARAPVLSGAPKPLALDLSPSGLIVRVRSVLGGALGSEAPAAPAAALPIPGPSTALLERGAMLEAFSVAHAYADSLASGRNARAGGVAAASHAPPAPGSAPVQLALWWAWLALPLLLVAIRFYL